MKLANFTKLVVLSQTIHEFNKDSMHLVYKDFYIKKSRELYVINQLCQNKIIVLKCLIISYSPRLVVSSNLLDTNKRYYLIKQGATNTIHKPLKRSCSDINSISRSFNGG